MVRTMVVIPAYNAATTLEELLLRLTGIVPREDVIVVNDGSEDSTGTIAHKAGVGLVELSANSGKGIALTRGFEAALRFSDADAVITMDADLQHGPDDIEKFVACRERTRASVILGVRKRWGTTMPLERRLSNLITSLMVSARTGVHVQDSQCGYRLIGREALASVRTEAAGFEAETEFLIRAARAGYAFDSVPIETHYNKETSHMTYWNTTKRFVQILFGEY